MARRTLGGGRVLGGGDSLSPAVAAQHKRNASLLSPSESSISLDSQASTSHTSTEEPDLASRVSLPTAEASSVATASARLVCPICNEEMVTLLQLNRHLDDAHQNLEEVEQDEVKNWFRTQMVKAKRFQPLAVLNQKFKGLDVFEPNDAPVPPAAISNGRSTPELVRAPDEFVTREHWQRSTGRDSCSDPMCDKRLGPLNGNINCRKCGKLFCEDHTMYQMKLSRSAQHEPVRGVWCRVCETCYKSREGYNDHDGFERDHTQEFSSMRRKTVDKAYLEVSRLEKRLTKLTQLLTDPALLDQASGSYWPLAAAKNQRKSLEQSVVTWEDDASVSHCPFCKQEFSNYTFRRHHCRLCGRVVCGDPQTGCSSEVGLNVAAMTRNMSEKAASQLSVDVRMCKDCKHTIFSKRDFASEIAHKPADVRAYENLVQFERGIRQMLPIFHRLLTILQDPDKPPTQAELAEASKIRRRLIDAFGQYDTAARRIRDLPTRSPTQQKLQKAIYQQATSFLHLHMLPLKTLPKILKHATPAAGTSSPLSRGPLAAIRSASSPAGDSSSVTSGTSIEAMEAEERELRERLIVLEEQKFLVSEMLAEANKHRRWDEAGALQSNIRDLEKEIDDLKGKVEGLDFRSAYMGGLT